MDNKCSIFMFIGDGSLNSDRFKIGGRKLTAVKKANNSLARNVDLSMM